MAISINITSSTIAIFPKSIYMVCSLDGGFCTSTLYGIES